MKYLKNINELISEKFKSDEEFDDLLNYLLNNFFSHEKVDLLEEVVENSIISLDFMKLSRISFSHTGFVLRNSSMSASRDLNPAIINDIKSASELRGSQYWDRINGWSHLFSSAKDMIVRGAKPYYKYRVNFTIDSGYGELSQYEIIRYLAHSPHSEETKSIKELIIKTIKRELAFEGLNVKVSFNPSFLGGRYFDSDITITDLDYVYNPDLIS